jgi:hypothetical protein
VRSFWAGLALVLASLAPAGAQAPSAELIDQAKRLYEGLEIEQAMPLLRQVLASSSLDSVSRPQRVEASIYLGASLALMGLADSSVHYFRRALELDPFTDLDAARFTPDQMRLFAEARRRTFEVGVRPVAAGRVDPRTERVSFLVAVTRTAQLTAELRGAAEAPGVVLFHGEASGPRELRWDALLGDGRLAPPGRYSLTVTAASSPAGRSDTARVYFDVRHDVESLEDTLPATLAAALLPERYTSGDARRELVKGAGIAAAALLVAEALGHQDFDGGRAPSRVVAGVALVTGVVAMLTRGAHPEIPANVAENQRRADARRATNDAIRRRNAERLARTALVIEPAAGAEL